ncbi:methyltransferase domain-containing protein [bacterium]|nr:methyltransferase domain-containing protein [bacterium]
MPEDFYQKGLAYLDQFQMEMPDWLEEIKTTGLNYKVPIIDDDMGRFLRIICSLKKPGKILEIGCGISYATHWMLLGSPESEITGLDYNADRLKFCRNFLKKSGFSKKVSLERIWANDFFEKNDTTFDLILQDSTKKDYAGMIESCYQCLNTNGLLIVDNIFFNQKVFGLLPEQEKKYKKAVLALEQFNQEISQHPGFSCHFLAISDGVLIAQRK